MADDYPDEAASDLAAEIRRYRDHVQDEVAPDEDHLDSVVSAKDVAQNLTSILAEHDAQHPGLELVVEFRQRFTVKPPETLTDPVYAEDWFWNIYPEIGTDVVDTRQKDHFDIVAVRPRGDEWG